MSRTDAFVRFLRILGFFGIGADTEIFFAELFFDHLGNFGDSDFRKMRGVRTHVGDVSGFVELLSDAHGARRSEAEPRGSGLLQGRGDEWRARLAGCFCFFDILDDPRAFFSCGDNCFEHNFFGRLFFAGQRQLVFFLGLDIGRDDPKGVRKKCADFPFAFHDDAQCRRLHAPS